MEILKSKNIDDLENKKPSHLLWQYAAPAIIGTAVVALYNIIDSIYIGHAPELGDHAIGGLGVLLPVMNFASGIGMLIGAGTATRISIYLGQKNKEAAEKVLGTSISLAFILTSLFIILSYIYINPLLVSIGATPETLPFAKEFLIYYLPGNIFLTINFGLNSALRSSGYPKKAMYMMLIGVLANIILAPIFIFIFNWGMKGAAMATNISILISLIGVTVHFLNKKNTLSLYLKKIRLNPAISWSIINIGFAPFFMLLAASIVVIIINNQLKIYGGSTAIEAYVMSNRIVMVFIMVLVGLTQGMQPIIGYNYGAKKTNRVKETLYYTLKVGFCIGCIGFILGNFLPHTLMQAFNPSPDLEKLSTHALQLMTLTLPLSGIQMVISNFFQCIGKSVNAFLLSMTRQFIFLVPCLFILPHFIHLNGIWYSIPFSDLTSTIIAIFMLLWQMNHLRKSITV